VREDIEQDRLRAPLPDFGPSLGRESGFVSFALDLVELLDQTAEELCRTRGFLGRIAELSIHMRPTPGDADARAEFRLDDLLRRRAVAAVTIADEPALEVAQQVGERRAVALLPTRANQQPCLDQRRFTVYPLSSPGGCIGNVRSGEVLQAIDSGHASPISTDLGSQDKTCVARCGARKGAARSLRSVEA